MSTSDTYDHKIEYNDIGEIKSECWYKNGLLHRDDDSPAHIEYINGMIFITMYYKEGKLHREKLLNDSFEEIEYSRDLPAWISYFNYPDSKMSELWFKNGVQERESDVNGVHLPAQVEYYENGTIHSETYFINGKKNRDNDLPVNITYTINGVPYISAWFKDDIRHRDYDKPAYIKLYENGNIEEKEWFYNGVLHRDSKPDLLEPGSNLPAAISYYEDGVVRAKHWYQYGNYHREQTQSLQKGAKHNLKDTRGLPSCIYYYENGMVESKQWYYHGQSYFENNISNLVKYNRNGDKELERWYSPGHVLSRLNGPSEIMYELDTIYGKRTVKLYYINNAWCPTIKYFIRTDYIKRFVDNIRKCQRSRLLDKIKSINIRSRDVCELITRFVY